MYTTKKKNSFLCWVLVLLLFCLGLITALSFGTYGIKINAYAAETDMSIYTFVPTSDTTCSVRLSDKTVTEAHLLRPIVTIGGSEYQITEVAASGFASAPNLKSVYLPSSVKIIGTSAFMNCKSLEIVSIPAVNSIGANAFAMCPELTDLVIPTTVETIGATILRSNTTQVHVRDSSNKVGWTSTWNANNNTTSIEYNSEFELPVLYEEVQNITPNSFGISSFSNTSAYKVIAHPYGEATFYATKDVVLGTEEVEESAFEIGSWVFTDANFSTLTIKYSNEPVFIRSYAFAFCNMEILNEYYETGDIIPSSIIINRDVILEDDIDGVSDGVFMGASITSIVLPNTISVFGPSMFSECMFLKDIQFIEPSLDNDEGLEIISTGEVILPSTKYIEEGVEKIIELAIYNSAFANTTSISHIIIPENVKTVTGSIFDGWKVGQLITIQYPTIDDLPQWTGTSGWNHIWYLDAIKNITEFLLKTYKITFIVNGAETNSRSITNMMTFQELNVPNPVIEDKNFIGWYWESTLENIVLSTDSFSNDTNLYAKFETKTFLIDFAQNAYATFKVSSYPPVINDNGNYYVEYGKDIRFTLTTNDKYNQSTPTIRVNGIILELIDDSYVILNIKEIKTITVDAMALNTYTITPNVSANGTINPNTSTIVNYGANQMFTITANSGYYISEVKVDGVAVNIITTSADLNNRTTEGTYTLSNVTTNKVIVVTFAQLTYSITTIITGNGAINPTEVMNVPYGESRSFNVKAEIGYYISNVAISGANATYQFVSKDSNNRDMERNYTLSNITADSEIFVTFSRLTYNVLGIAGANGSVSPSSKVVNYGDNHTFTVKANQGYWISSYSSLGLSQTDIIVISRDNNSHETEFTCTFKNIKDDITFDAEFKRLTYEIIAEYFSNGEISPSETIFYGENKSFTIKSNYGFRISKIEVDNVAVSYQAVLIDSKGNITEGKYTFVNVTANHTISVTLDFIIYDISTEVLSGSGIIDPASLKAEFMERVSFMFVASAGYYVSEVKVNGSLINVGVISSDKGLTTSGLYSNHYVAADTKITVKFGLISYNISTYASANGTINPSIKTPINVTESKSFTIKAADGYYISKVSIGNNVYNTQTLIKGILPSHVTYGAYNNVTQGTYTFANITADTLISAEFLPNSFTVYIDANGGVLGATTYVIATYGQPMPTIAVNNLPTKIGNNIAGLFLNNKQYYNENGASTRNWEETIEGSVLSAKWAHRDFTVTLNPQGGIDGTEIIYGVKFDEVMPSGYIKPRYGYVFAGYYSGINGTGKRYYDANMNSTNKWDIADNVPIYAYWTTEKSISQCLYNGVYEIWTRQQFSDIRNTPTSGKTFKLMQNVSLYNPLSSNSWIPIPNFFGTLDGSGYDIFDMSIDYVANTLTNNIFVGIFGELENATIKNLNIRNSTIKYRYDSSVPTNHDGAGGNFAGILCGRAVNSTLDTIKIIDCHVEVHRDFSSIGGVVGEIDHVTLKTVSVDGLHLEGNGDMGGITGKAYYSTFENSGIIKAGPILHHSVTSNRSVGGITGYSFNSNYIGCVILLVTMELRGNMNAQTAMGFIIGYMDCGIIEGAIILLAVKKCELPPNPNGWEARYFKYNQGLIGHKIGTTSVDYNNV